MLIRLIPLLQEDPVLWYFAKQCCYFIKHNCSLFFVVEDQWLTEQGISSNGLTSQQCLVYFWRRANIEILWNLPDIFRIDNRSEDKICPLLSVSWGAFDTSSIFDKSLVCDQAKMSDQGPLQTCREVIRPQDDKLLSSPSINIWPPVSDHTERLEG